MVRIESEPSGAKVQLSNGAQGVTPLEIELPRKTTTSVHIEKDGYYPADAAFSPLQTKQGRVAFAGNALLGGVIGSAIDSSNGADLDLVPNPMKVRLKPLRPKDAPRDWGSIKAGSTRSEVRDALGEPEKISDSSGDQTWTYKDGGVVRFHDFFVSSWEQSSRPGIATDDSARSTK